MSQLLLRSYIHASTGLASLGRTDALDAGEHLDRSHEDDVTDLGHPSEPRRRDVGQATTEYALVMLGAAAVALLVVTWATAGGGAGRIGRLFDRVIDAVLGRI
jgi:hypothetical protein